MNNAATTDANGQKHETPAWWRPGERGRSVERERLNTEEEMDRRDGGGGEELQSFPGSCQDFPVVHFSRVSK